MSKKITLYSKPVCVQCTATVRWFDKHGLVEGRDYTKVDVSADLEALEYVKSLGYLEAPVVVVLRNKRFADWSGFNPEMLEEHCA